MILKEKKIFRKMFIVTEYAALTVSSESNCLHRLPADDTGREELNTSREELNGLI